MFTRLRSPRCSSVLSLNRNNNIDSLTEMSRPSVLAGPPPPSHPPPTHRGNVHRASPYAPGPHELHPGARNRLILALKSGIPSEVDWALPRLVVGSFDSPEHFRLEAWVDSVAALQVWPEKWLAHLEEVASIRLVRAGAPAPNNVKALVPEWTIDPDVARRATESLQVLRNASFIGSAPKIIARQSFLAWLDRLFALPLDMLAEIMVSNPEAMSHVLIIISSILPHIRHTPAILRLLSDTLPNLFLDTRDSAMMVLILPLLISASSIQTLPSFPSELVGHLMRLLSNYPPQPLLDLVLDLLVGLAAHTASARHILSSPSIGVYLRSIVPYLSYGSKPFTARWESTPSLAGKLVRNPASQSGLAEEASRRRGLEREAAQKAMDAGQMVDTPTGDKPPQLAPAIMKKLFTMPEPDRSILW